MRLVDLAERDKRKSLLRLMDWVTAEIKPQP
jgi:hypothetical protein